MVGLDSLTADTAVVVVDEAVEVRETDFLAVVGTVVEAEFDTAQAEPTKK